MSEFPPNDGIIWLMPSRTASTHERERATSDETDVGTTSTRPYSVFTRAAIAARTGAQSAGTWASAGGIARLRHAATTQFKQLTRMGFHSFKTFFRQ